MDGRGFAKLARDCGLLGAGLTPAQVDLVFSKVRGKARARRDARRGLPPPMGPLTRVRQPEGAVTAA